MKRPAVAILAAITVAITAFFGGVAAGRGRRSGAQIKRSAPAAAAVNARVFVYGDSLVTQSEPYLVVVGKALGLTVTSRAFDGTAPCDFLGKFRDDLAAKRVDEAVWAFSGNSIGSCMLDRLGHPLVGAARLAKYRTDTEAAITASETAKVSFVLASPPAPRSTGDGWQQLDAVYREVASAHPRVQYADDGAAIAPNGQFLATQRCLPFEDLIPQARDACTTGSGTITVRGADGVHFCSAMKKIACPTYSSGAFRYAINLLSAARLEIDYQAHLPASPSSD